MSARLFARGTLSLANDDGVRLSNRPMVKSAAMAAMVVALLCVVSCAVPTARTSTIAFNVGEDPHSLDPLLAQTDDEQQVARLMFDLLVDVDARGRPIPDLASAVPTVANGGVSRDGKTIVYHLRHGVRWQDGAPFTSHDVWFTWQQVVDPHNDVASTRGYDLIASIDTPDRYTAIVHLSRAWAPAVATLFSYGVHPVPIVPAHVLEGHGPLRTSPFNEHPVGTGPYELETWERGDHLTFRANPAYFRGRPKTERLVVREVPDPNGDITMLRSGELDWSLLSPGQRATLAGVTDLRFIFAPLAGFGGITFNCRRPPFDDPLMRRAVALSLDRQRMSKEITRSQYPVTDSDLPPYSWAYDASAREPDFDPSAADTLLDSLGWRKGPDGVRRKDGRPLSVTFVTFPEGDTAVRTAIFAQAMLHARGFDVHVKRITVAELYLPASAGGVLMSGSYDMAYFAWRSGTDPDDSDLVTCKGGANYAGYCDPALDALEDRALSTIDPAARKQLYSAVQHRVADAVPYLYLYAPTYGFAVHADVEGLNPTPYSPTWNAFEWVRR
jgi:peptide/nickel transport system substrate-binding protein